MRLIDLARKDSLQLVRDWKAAVFLVVMPVVFTLMFGFAFGGLGGGDEDPRLPVGLLDQDGGGILSRSLLDLLSVSPVIRPVVLEEVDAGEVAERVTEEELAAAVIVPAGYSELILAGGVARLTILVDQGSAAGSTAHNEILAVTTRLVGAVQAAQLGAEVYASQVGFADEPARREFVEEGLYRAVGAWQNPPLTAANTVSGAIVQDDEGEYVLQSGFSHTSPSMMVQFAIAGLIGAGEILVLERKSGALRRLLTTAMSRLEIILGHFLVMFVMILLQLALLIVFGQVLLNVDYLREPLAVVLMMVTTALWAASMGLLIGVLAKTEGQVIIFSLVPMFILAGLGGVWVPLEFTGEAFQTVGHLTPTAWAMEGFENIVIRGLGLDSVLVPAGILLVYAVALFALAVWRFKFE